MKELKISAKLIGITDDIEKYFFEVQCGNGPMVLTSSIANDFTVPLVSSSSSVAHLSVNIIGKVGSVKKLFGSKVSKIKCSARSETLDLVYSKDSGDQIDAIVKIMYQLIPCKVFDAINQLGNGQGICASVSFVGTIKEDLSIRVLNDQGTCISMSTIDKDSVSSFIILHPEHKKMELSIAGKNTGVITVPIEDGVPFVTKIESYPSGYILLCIQLIQGASGRVMCLDEVLFNPPTGEQYVYHLENIRMDAEESVPMNATSVCKGVVHGPILSRLELPSFSQGIGNRIVYALPSPPPLATTTASGNESPRALAPFDNDIRGLVISQDDPSAPVRARLSVIKVIESDKQSEDQVYEGVCGIVLISAVLKEVDRLSFGQEINEGEDGHEEARPDPGDTMDSSDKTESHESKEEDATQEARDAKGEELKKESAATASSSPKKYRPSRVSLAGEIDYVVDLPDMPVMVGDRLAASVIITEIEASSLEDEDEDDVDRLEAESSLEAILQNASSPRVMESADAIPIPHHSQEPQLSPKPNLGNHLSSSNMSGVSVGNGTSIIQLLSDELKEKQRVIDKLLDDNASKAKVISEHATGVTVFQKEISLLKTKLTETQAALSYREQESDSALRLAEEGADDPQSLFHCSRQMLIDAVIQSSNRYRKADKERLELKKIITDSVSIRRQFGDLQKAYRDLQDAHVTQARHIQKMQTQQSKVTTYESTIMLQEKVISKMQSVIEAHLKSSNESGRHSLGSKNEMLIDRQVNPKRSLRHNSMDGEDLREKCHSLEAEVKSKDIRLEALQEQLVRSSQEAAREIATLRMKIFDLEMSASGTSSVGDPDEFVPNRSSQSNLLIPYGNMMDDKSSRHSLSRGTTANSSAYADLGGKVYVPSQGSSKGSLTASSMHRARGQDESRVSESRKRHMTENGSEVPAGRVSPIQQKSKPFMEMAYRPDSKTGSPRPVSPSEASDFQSFSGSPRMQSKYPIASARNRPDPSDLHLPLGTPPGDKRGDSSGRGSDKGAGGSQSASRLPSGRLLSDYKPRDAQSPANRENSASRDRAVFPDALQTLLSTDGGNPPLGDLSTVSNTGGGPDELEGIARKQSINSIRSSRSAGSTHHRGIV